MQFLYLKLEPWQAAFPPFGAVRLVRLWHSYPQLPAPFHANYVRAHRLSVGRLIILCNTSSWERAWARKVRATISLIFDIIDIQNREFRHILQNMAK